MERLFFVVGGLGVEGALGGDQRDGQRRPKETAFDREELGGALHQRVV
jgi:hypothetical protein